MNDFFTSSDINKYRTVDIKEENFKDLTIIPVK